MERRVLVAILSATLLLLPAALSAQAFADFEDFLRQYAAANPKAQSALARSFVAEQRNHGGFPIADGSGRVTFVYVAEGAQRDVRLVGDFHTRSFSNVYWDIVGEPLSRVGSVFYTRRTFEPDARLDYRFLVDGDKTLDPLNPRTIVSGAGDGEASELVMPQHRIPAAIAVTTSAPRGALHVVQEAWATPKVTIYLPANYDPRRDYPTLYTADGSGWIAYIGLPTILDNLIASRSMPPIIAVLIDAAADRSAWYDCNPDYLAYLKRVVAYVDGRYATRARATARILAGTSAGAKAAAYAGFTLPDVFGNVGLLSPSISPTPPCLASYLDGRASVPHLRAWIAAGTYEGAIHRESEALGTFLHQVGIPVETRSVHQGHSFGAWREGAVEMLPYFFREPEGP